ncbi:MAG: hypothetical protein JEZ04_03810 [Spirochaetales bacterium]|nr:hypothetical protein [Spirochaetales bacterium]
MKKFTVIILVLLLFAAVYNVSAQDMDSLIAGLGKDFSLFLDGLGDDLTPILMQNAIAGQNIGIAELGDSVFYINIIPVIAATAGNGLLTNRASTDYYQVINLDSTIGSMVSVALGDDLTTLILDNLTPIPTFKLNAGIKLPLDLELLVTGFWIPDFLIPFVKDNLVPEIPAGIELSALNIGGLIRYPLLKDGEKSPGLSVGVGYFFDSFHAGLGLATLLGEDMGITLAEGSGMSIDTNVHVFGAELTISKKLLFFAPYAKLGAWYGISSFTGSAVLTDPENPITGGKIVNDFAFIAGAGFDLLFGPFCMNFGGSYNLGNGILGISLGSRLQF